ncbi:MAG TPA: SDR family oxidoreductase [Acidimicrobiales bacterium]|jgi:NAD(P)-dependent dehydrogenase (short-subunit alcohol dehydrogenase family)|nr:SDR family oxidoreductase [Acidimicrobiales bacterium]
MTTEGPDLEGRVAVVTGGGGAIGGASCVLLAEHGADVVIADNDAERAAGVAAEVERRGRKALPVVVDLTAEGGVAELAERAQAAFDHVDILVNGLGEHLAMAGPWDRSTEEQWDALYRVNLLHVFQASRAFAPGMCERGWGKIVNFSSVEGIRAMPSHPVYTAFKGAIDSFTKSLGVDLAGRGVNVNCIAVDKTKAYQVNFYQLGEEYDRMVPVWIPAGRYAEADDVAKVVLFLSTDQSAWVVGQTIPADGGTLAAGGWYRTPGRWTNSPLLVQYFEDDPSINQARPPSVQ